MARLAHRSLSRVRRADAPFACESLEPRIALSTVSWDGGGDGVTLTDRYNWDCNQVPGIYDTAVINVAANPSIQHNAGTFKVKKLLLSEELTVDGGTVIVCALTSVNASGTLNMAGGLFDGAGLLSVSGKLAWTGGRISGWGDIEIAPPGLFVIDTDSTLELRRDVKSLGNTVWLNGNIDGYDNLGTCITNEAGATFKAMGEGRFRSQCWPGAFVNKGTLVRDEAGFTRLLVPVTNSGVMNVAGGSLQLWAGGANTGSRHVAEGGTLHYFQNFTHGAGSTLTGGGTTIWQGGTHTLAADWTLASYLHVTNSTVTGPGTLSIDSPLTWNSGLLAGDGQMVINPTGKITVATDGQHRLARDIVNNGTLIWNNGGLAFEGATITNNAEKFFFIRAHETAENVSGENRIVNHGEIRKQLPTDMGLGGVTLDNQGFLNVRNGSVTLDPASVQQIEGTTLTGGAWSVFRTAQINLPGLAIDTVGSAASVTRIGADSSIAALVTLSRNDGRITVIGGGALTVAPASGTFVNAGILDLRAGTHLSVDGDFEQTETGFLRIRVAGPFLLGSGRMVAAHHASLAGTALFDFGLFAPQAGQRYVFLGAESISGELTLPPGPIYPGLTGALTYLDHAVRLDIL